MSEFYDHDFRRTAMRPTARTWIKHTIFFLITFFTVTLAGVLPPFGVLQFPPSTGGDPQSWAELFQFLSALPAAYYSLITETIYALFMRPEVFTYGLSFSLSLLFILLCHEFGHYIACRIYGVDATLPYFIPTPPLLGPAGTFGAFIKIVSPMPSRKAVFDIGVAGPIAGFVALIPVALLGFLTLKTAPFDAANDLGIYFADPPFFKILAFLSGADLSGSIAPNPFYSAAWLGLLVTALNLFPSGQLDGGHALYALFGAAAHRWSGRLVFIVMAVLAVAGWFLYNSPSGFLFAILLGVMLRVGHPEPYDIAPLDNKRKIIAALTLLIFVLCFVPFPIQVR